MPTIQQLSASDARTTLVLDNFIEAAPIIADLNAEDAFYTREGDSDRVREGRDADSGGIFRGVNTDNNPSAANVTYVSGDKKIVSFTATVDKINEQRGNDIDSELAYETGAKAENAGYRFQKAMFEGDSGTNADEIDGFRAQASGDQVEEPDEKLVVPLGGDAQKQAQQEFMEYFMTWMDSIPGGADYVYVNGKLRTRLLLVAKNLGFYRQSKDALGNEIEMIGDVAIQSAGWGPDRNRLLPFTESFTDLNGTTHDDTSSAFAARYGTRRQTTMLTSQGGCMVDFDGNYGSNHIAHHVNMDTAPIVQEPEALQQLRGLALSA